MENLKDQQDRVEAANRAAREAKAWLQFLMQHPEVRGESSRLMALEYHNGTEMTLESLNESYENPNFRATLAIQAPPTEEQRRDAAKKTVEQSGQTTSKWQSTEELEQKAADLTARRELSKKTPAELRAIIKENSPVVDDSGPTMPEHMTRAWLLALNKPGEFKRVCDRYGVVAVTERLNTRS